MPPGFQASAREAIRYMHVTGCYHFLDRIAPGAVQARHFLDAMGTVLGTVSGKRALVLWKDKHEQGMARAYSTVSRQRITPP